MHARQPVLCCKREQDRGIPATLPWLRPVVKAEPSCWSGHLAGWRAETMPIVAWVASAAWSSCKSLGHTAYVLCFGGKKKQSTRRFSSGGLRWMASSKKQPSACVCVRGHTFVRLFSWDVFYQSRPFLSRGLHRFRTGKDHYSTNFKAIRKVENKQHQ